MKVKTHREWRGSWRGIRIQHAGCFHAGTVKQSTLPCNRRGRHTLCGPVTGPDKIRLDIAWTHRVRKYEL